MVYRKFKNGAHAVGSPIDGRFIVYTSAFDAREETGDSHEWHFQLAQL